VADGDLLVADEHLALQEPHGILQQPEHLAPDELVKLLQACRAVVAHAPV